MTTFTTRYAFPKPEGTDPISLGYDAIADLADAVDTLIYARRPLYAVKAAQQAVTNSVALVSDSHLFLDLVAGRTYEVVAHLAVSGNGTNDIKTSWTTTGSIGLAGSRSGTGMAPAATARDNAAQTVMGAVAINGTIPYGTDSGGNISWVREEMLVLCSVAGRLTLQWAQNVATAGAATTVWNSSWLRAVSLG